MRRVPAPLRVLVALVMAAAAVMTWTSGEAPAQTAPQADPAYRLGGAIYADACSDCHGTDLRGRAQRGPTLAGAGAAAVDFYVRTGRMPLARPGIEPEGAQPVYDARERAALVAYVTARAPGGPGIPRVDPAAGDLTRGRELFMDSCSGCHQAMGRGGIGPGFVAPQLTMATPTEIGEAIRVGPYLMPRFSEARLDQADVDSIARYVTDVVQDPPDEGGWGIGNIGPIPEGLVAFLLAGGSLLIVIRLIGEGLR